MRQQRDEKAKARQKAKDRFRIGPLGQRVDHVFSGLTYQDTSSPLPMTIWCGPEAIIILAETHHLHSSEIDITVADQALFLKIEPIDAPPANSLAILEDKATDEGPFTVPLLYQVDADQVEAQYDDHLLHIVLPRLDTDGVADNHLQFVH
jgi:HSP20 family molecular chaperone IbpA